MGLIRAFDHKGYTAEYLRFSHFETMNHELRECVAIFCLFKDKATAEANAADVFVERAVRLVLSGDKFDQWVGKEVIAGPPAKDITAQLYLAAKAEPVGFWGGRLPNLADAQDDL